MKIDLKFDFKHWLPLLRKFQPYIFGLLLIGVFGYTALVVNAALNVKQDANAPLAPDPAAKVTFDKATIDAVKKLNVVPGSVPTGELGKSDPFK